MSIITWLVRWTELANHSACPWKLTNCLLILPIILTKEIHGPSILWMDNFGDYVFFVRRNLWRHFLTKISRRFRRKHVILAPALVKRLHKCPMTGQVPWVLIQVVLSRLYQPGRTDGLPDVYICLVADKKLNADSRFVVNTLLTKNHTFVWDNINSMMN